MGACGCLCVAGSSYYVCGVVVREMEVFVSVSDYM